MKQIKHLPSNVFYLYSYVDSKDYVCKLYRSRSGRSVYLVYNTGEIYSMDEKALKNLSNKIYDAAEQIREANAKES